MQQMFVSWEKIKDNDLSLSHNALHAGKRPSCLVKQRLVHV